MFTSVHGRRCAVPDIHSSNGGVRAYAERNAVNYTVQVSAANIIKVAMVKIFKRLQDEGLASKILCRCTMNWSSMYRWWRWRSCRSWIKEEMEGAIELTVPLTVAVGVGKNWREAH